MENPFIQYDNAYQNYFDDDFEERLKDREEYEEWEGNYLYVLWREEQGT